ncbi:Uncharacterised protein [Klebsiella pneumoniae]|nr:Uncharacterised protein [Klebsiella pneumoniae]STT97138.1 Uncharacterised protein [Klebsiella pneumoniae]VTO00158.1 Uncharacterised protein [Klebsiella pneumoniae]
MLRKLWGKKGIPNSSRIEDVLIEQNRELSNVLNMLVKNSGPGRSIIELRDIERAIKNPEIESRELTIKRILYIEKYLTDLFYEVYKVRDWDSQLILFKKYLEESARKDDGELMERESF